MRHPNSLANLGPHPELLSPHAHKGPSRYALLILRALLRKPMPVSALAQVTNLAERSVKAQIAHLKASGCVRVVRRVQQRPSAGPWAVYGIVVNDMGEA